MLNILKFNGILLVAIFLPLQIAHAQVQPTDPMSCSDISGVHEMPSIYFMVSPATSSHFASSTLISEAGGLANWMEVEYSNEGIRLANRLPGVGLPFSLFNLRLELIDTNSHVVSFSELARPDDCQILSFFAGQRSRYFRLPDVNPALKHLRLRVRILASEY